MSEPSSSVDELPPQAESKKRGKTKAARMNARAALVAVGRDELDVHTLTIAN